MKTQRQSARDGKGRTWDISVVPVERAEEEDFEFWWKMRPEDRVRAVKECTLSALRAQGNAKPDVGRLRRVARIVKRRGR